MCQQNIKLCFDLCLRTYSRLFYCRRCISLHVADHLLALMQCDIPLCTRLSVLACVQVESSSSPVHQTLPAWAAGRSTAQLVALAREAAEQMVQGSGSEAAATAAERALRSGGVCLLGVS